MKKEILVIHTGGTISMAEDASTGGVSLAEKNPLSVQEEILADLAEISVEEPFNLPSPHITAKEMLLIKNLIEEKLQEKEFDGVVITHGTDTLEETAYFLDLTLDTQVPVVVTGAMRSSNEIGSDGLYNYISAIRVASSTEAWNMGVLVVLNDEIHTAANATKTHTSNVSTFQSPQFGPIGIVTKRNVLFHHSSLNKEKYPLQTISKRTALLKAHAGMDSSLFYALKEMNIDGLVIEALGQGNLPPAVLPGLKALLDEGIPVVAVSRCFNGIAQDTYAYEGGGRQLKELGVIFSNGLNGQKARIKLLIALHHAKDHEEFAWIFSQS